MRAGEIPVRSEIANLSGQGVGMNLSGGLANRFIAASLNPVQTLPEPSEGLAAVVVLLTLGVARMRNRDRRVFEKPGKRTNHGKAQHAHI